jgi:large subunit ribosomal protein L4
MKASVYDMKGKEVRSIELPENVFGAKRNDSLMHQVVLAMEGNARTNVAHTKGRGEVRGGGKKPWKQKGTGRARHGSSRSPIWRGGGVTHGPLKEKNYKNTVNKKMRARALAVVLSGKMRDGRILFVDQLSFAAPKTKDAKATLSALSKIKGFSDLAERRRNAALIAVSGRDQNTEKSFSNMGNVELVEARNLNPVSVISYRYLVLANPEEAVKSLSARLK